MRKKILTLQYSPDRITAIMEKHQISCRELGEAVGVSAPAIAYYRTGQRKEQSDTVRKIAKYFKSLGIADAYSILEPQADQNKSKKKETKPMLSPECIAYYNFNQEVFPSGYIPDENILETETVRKALSMLTYAAKNSGFVLMTGKSGSGKSTITRRLIKQLKLNKKIITVIPDPFDSAILDPYQILAEIIDQATSKSMKIPFKKVDRSRGLATVMAEKNKNKINVVILIDETQDLPKPTLIALKRAWERYLVYPGLLSVILVSLPEISFTLSNSQLEQVAKRITEIQLRPFSDDNAVMIKEITSYIQHHIKIAGGDPELFDDGAIKAIAPRVETLLELHNICTKAIMRAYEIKEKKITAKIIANV